MLKIVTLCNLIWIFFRLTFCNKIKNKYIVFMFNDKCHMVSWLITYRKQWFNFHCNQTHRWQNGIKFQSEAGKTVMSETNQFLLVLLIALESPHTPHASSTSYYFLHFLFFIHIIIISCLLPCVCLEQETVSDEVLTSSFKVHHDAFVHMMYVWP